MNNKIQAMSWLMKTSLVLLLTLVTTVLILGQPRVAQASVSALNAWPATPQIVSNAATGTVTGPVTVSAGTGTRVMLVVVGAEYTAAPSTQPMTVTFGGKTVTQLQQVLGSTNTLWLGYINQADLTAASNSTLSVTNGNTTNLVAMYAAAAVFDGVSQSSPISGTSSVFSSTAVNNLTLPSINVKGAVGNSALSFYFTNRNGQVSTVDASYTKNQDYAGTNFNMSFNTITTAPTSLTTTAPVANTATTSVGSAVAVALVPNGVTGIGVVSSCSSCHGNPPVDSTARNTPIGSFKGSHNKHTGTAAGQYGLACTTCHFNHTTFAHQNGYINISGANSGIHLNGTAYTQGKKKPVVNNPAYGSCANTYCHSSGTGGTGQAGDTRSIGAPATTLTWATNTSSCTSCHAGTATGPTYTNGSPKANSHNAHRVTNGYTCNICHYNTTTNGTSITGAAYHPNKTYDVVPDPSKSFTYTYASTGGTCKNSGCHGGAGINLAWGQNRGTTQCTKCHGIQSGFTNFSAASTAPGSATGSDLAGNFNVSTRGGVHQAHLTAADGISANNMRCGTCHTTVTSVGAATHMRYTTATISFGPLAKGIVSGGSQTHFPTVTRVNGAIQCNNTYCHSGGRRPAGTAAGQADAGGATRVIPTFNNGTMLDGTTVNGTCLNKCHGLPPGGGVAGDSHAGLSNNSAGNVYNTPALIGSTCSSISPGTGCHPTINPSATTIANLFADKTLHINGSIEGGSCTGCHAPAGTADVNGRRTIKDQFDTAGNSHHVQITSNITTTACYACHWEANSDGSMSTHHKENGKVQLVIWGTSTTRPTTYNATTYVFYSSGRTTNSTRTELAKVNNHCLGCHNSTNKTTQPWLALGDSGSPSMYSWEGLSTALGGFGAAQDISSKYLSTTTTNWGKYAGNNTNAKNGQIKAFSAHGNAAVNQRGWSTLEEKWGVAVANYPNTSGTVNVLCFDCHNSHGSSAPTTYANAVTTSYSSATGRYKGGIMKDTVAGKGGYSVTYKPYSGGNPTQKNPYKSGAGLCFDCHNNANAGATTSTGYAAPWGYQGTYGSTAAIQGYNDSAYFGKSGAPFAKGITYTYIGTGLSTNKGGHLSASSTLNTSPTRKIGGLCTPCHDPHGVSPGLAAGDQQYAVPLLKGTFATSPYKQDAAPANTNEIRGGGCQRPELTVSSTIGYHIDMNTLQASTTGKWRSAGTPAETPYYWTFATNANTLQTLADTQFAGLCMKCHAKAAINGTAAASTTNWRTMGRIHNTVDGWATTGGGNAGNAVHSYTCSKCHASHNSNLPRLLVTNCLDVKHRGRVASGGDTLPGSSVPNYQTGSRGAGLGRFPGGGSYGHSRNASTATNPGPWFFGVRQSTLVTTTNLITTQKCHDSATAGGTTHSPATQQWNSRTPW